MSTMVYNICNRINLNIKGNVLIYIFSILLSALEFHCVPFRACGFYILKGDNSMPMLTID
jgi:hypothetical protein